MKRLIIVFLLISGLEGITQDTDYTLLLKPVREVELKDSLHIDTLPQTIAPLDSMTVKKWFSPVLGFTKNNRLKNRNYYLAGKITTHDKFDLLVLVEEKKKTDSNSVQVVYLISTKKDGSYIAYIEAAVGGTRKKSNYNISSWLYKDYKIVLDSKISVNEKSYDDMISYKINGGGRFILSGRDE